MMLPEEVLKNIEYIRCPDCFGVRIHPAGRQGLSLELCQRCAGWGYVVDPAEFEERIRLGLKAMYEDSVIETKRSRPPRTRPPKRRVRIRKKPPKRKVRKT